MKVKNKILAFFGIVFVLVVLAIVVLMTFFQPTSEKILLGLKLYSEITNDELYLEKERGIDVLDYNLHIDINQLGNTIKGEASITGTIDKNREQIVLDFYENYEIDYVGLNGQSCDYNCDENQIVIPKSEEIIDTFKVNIIYEGTPKSKGFGSFEFAMEGEDTVIYTLNEPSDPMIDTVILSNLCAEPSG